MKKLGLIAAVTFLLALIILAGATIWVKGHKEEIARSLTGKNIRFADLAFQYSPMPSIVFTDLTWTEGNYACTTPKLSLYPDLSDIFRGRIHIKKTILEKPLFVAQAVDVRQLDDTGHPLFSAKAYSMDTIPDGVMRINEGKIILKKTHGEILPIFVTAQAQKTNHHVSILFSQTSIEKMGLHFAGKVTVTSINPLKLHIEATQGTFNPSAVSNFLFKLGFLDEAITLLIPPITNIEAKSLTLDYDAGSGDIHLKTPSLIMDQTEFTDVILSLTDDGSFSLHWANGIVDAKSVYAWLHHIPEGKRLLDESLSRIRLKSISPEGTLRITSLDVEGKRQGDAKIDFHSLKAEMGIDVKDLRLGLVAENGQQEQITIDAFKAKVVFEQGQTAVQIEKMTFESPGGGTGQITGLVPFPLNLEKTTLHSTITAFKWFDTTVNLQLNKEEHPKASFDLAISSPSFELWSDGFFYIPGRNQTDLEVRIRHLQIADSTSKDNVKSEASKTILDQPFANHWIPEANFSATAWANQIQWGKYSPLQNVSIHFEAKKNAVVLTGNGRLCGINASISAYFMAPNRLVTTLEAKGTDVNLTSLVSCVSKELPVYLEGRLYVTGDFYAQGDNPREWIAGAKGDMMITVNRAVVHRISALDPRLGFFLDILNTAGIHKGYQDSITVNKGSVRANLQQRRLILDRFSLAGPMLKAWGKGEFVIENQRLRLTGGVTTQLGVTKKLNVDRYLRKKGDTG